jgi:hypothetical protein
MWNVHLLGGIGGPSTLAALTGATVAGDAALFAGNGCILHPLEQDDVHECVCDGQHRQECERMHKLERRSKVLAPNRKNELT